MELTWIWNVLLRRKWIVIQSMVLVGVVAMIGSYMIRPMYEASSKILLMQAKKGVIDVGSVGAQLASIIKTSADVDVNRVMAASRPYIDRMAFRLQLRDYNGNLIKAGRPVEATFGEKLSGVPSINVTQYRDTDILQIKAFSPDTGEAAMMANTLAEIMVDENQYQMRAEYRSARRFLEKQVANVKERYENILLELTDFKKEEKTIDLDIETKLDAEKMAELLRQKEDK